MTSERSASFCDVGVGGRAVAAALAGEQLHHHGTHGVLGHVHAAALRQCGRGNREGRAGAQQTDGNRLHSDPDTRRCTNATNQDAVRPRLTKSFGQLSQHIMENAAVPEVIQLVFGIYAHFCLETALGAVGIDQLPQRQPDAAAGRPLRQIVTVSAPVKVSDFQVTPSANCSGSTPMPTRLERWMRSKLSAITARTPSSWVPLAAQSRDEPVPYSLPAKTTSGVPLATGSAWPRRRSTSARRTGSAWSRRPRRRA